MEPAALIAVVEAAFDQPLASLFDDFEREPVASASIGRPRAASGGSPICPPTHG